MAKNQKTKAQTDSSPVETVLGYGFIICVGSSALAVLVILLGAFSGGSWTPIGLGLVPMLALPLGMVFLIILFILSTKRKKLNKLNHE